MAKDKKPTRPKERTKAKARALARWENEGGAISKKDRDKGVVLAETEEHILRCLGAALIMQWNDLPTGVQRTLFNHAVSLGEPRHLPRLKEGIARFLHTHKDDR